MKWKDWIENWSMTSLRIKTPFLDMEWNPGEGDRAAAWDMYVELLTRVTTQRLPDGHGDELTALNSVYSIFDLTRVVMKDNGRKCKEFTKIAVVVLNQVVRPFTAKWHILSLEGAFESADKCGEFRRELECLQDILRTYIKMLADMAGVEDLTELEDLDS